MNTYNIVQIMMIQLRELFSISRNNTNTELKTLKSIFMFPA